MESVYDSLARQLDGDLLGQISQRLGADRDVTQRAVPAALATLMGGLARNAGRREGAESLAAALARDHDGSVLDDPRGVLDHPEQGSGAGIVRHVFGGRQASVESALSQGTGLDGRAMGQLLTMLAPLVLGALGRSRKQGGLDAGGLADLLNRERRHVRERAPSGLGGLGSLLDADGDGDIKDDVARMGAGLLRRLMRRR